MLVREILRIIPPRENIFPEGNIIFLWKLFSISLLPSCNEIFLMLNKLNTQNTSDSNRFSTLLKQKCCEC